MSLMSGLRAFLRLDRGDAGSWPYHSGRYKVVDPTAPVVVVLRDTEALADDLVELASGGLCLVAPFCRRAADAERLVRNIAANLAIQHVITAGRDTVPAVDAVAAILSGREPESEQAAAIAVTLRAKLTDLDLGALTKQVKVVDMHACGDLDKIISKVNELAADAGRPDTGFRAPQGDGDAGVERVIAATQISYESKADKAGGYRLRVDHDRIVVEHYSPRNELLRVIEGKTARDLCITLIRNGWVSKLDHAAYLGRELMRAELALTSGQPYEQDRGLDSIDSETTRH